MVDGLVAVAFSLLYFHLQPKILFVSLVELGLDVLNLLSHLLEGLLPLFIQLTLRLLLFDEVPLQLPHPPAQLVNLVVFPARNILDLGTLVPLQLLNQFVLGRERLP